MSKRKPGRLFFANPGPTNIPDSVLRAMDRPTIDFTADDFNEAYAVAIAGLKRVLHTKGEVFFYTASGHGAWEATLLNMFSPGDHILVPEGGYFPSAWGAMGERYGLKVEYLPCDWRRGIDMAQLAARLAADTGHSIKAICAVHNETSTGVALPLQEIRAALDGCGHPALYLVDTISSLGCFAFKMDEWGIDAVVGGSQKGLMLPTGLAFTAAGPKAMLAHEQAKLPRFYFDWTMMMARPQRSFVGSIPTAPFYGMIEAIRLIEQEGLEALWARHHRLAEATRLAVRIWAANDGPQLYCTDPARVSDSVTTILLPDGHDADAFRKIALDRFNVSLGGGLGKLTNRVFRIGHLGDLNEPMILGTLGVVEMSLGLAGIPHGKGGVAAAMAYLAG